MQDDFQDALKGATTTIPIAGKMLGISRQSAYDAAKRGEIPTIRLGKRLVVPTAVLRQMLRMQAEIVA